MAKAFDCVVCGSCAVDILVRPYPLAEAVGSSRMVHVDPIEATTGGLASNAGVAMARLGMKVAVFSAIGDDEWSGIIRRKYQSEGIDTSHLLTCDSMPTSTTIVLVDEQGERSFAHCQGAPKTITPVDYFEKLALFESSRSMLLGYYSLMPNLIDELPEILKAIRERGCQTALDAAGDGGNLQPLDQLLPHLDFYVPSFAEATHQTGESDPRKIIDVYRDCGAPGLLGVKLGSQGALLSPRAGEYLSISAVSPPGPVVDTTGAGDSFYAGLLTGFLRGMSLVDAGRLAATAGACCVTALGASAGLRSFEETQAIAEQ